MYKITMNHNSGKYELIRNRDGRVMADAPTHDSIFYAMAYYMSQEKAHISGHLWRAAEEAAAGLVELHQHPAAQPHHLGFALDVATVNGYQILEVHAEQDAPSAPKPDPVYTCSCDFYTRANGKRPIIANMPVCKHILAGMMWRQWEIAPRTWEARQRQQERGRDTFGAIQQAEAARPRTKEYDDAHPEPYTAAQLDELAARTPGNIARRNRQRANQPQPIPAGMDTRPRSAAELDEILNQAAAAAAQPLPNQPF